MTLSESFQLIYNNLCGHTSIHVCSYWHLSYKLWNHDSSNRFTIYMVLIL